MSAFTTALAAVGSVTLAGSLVAGAPPASAQESTARVSTTSLGTGLEQVTGFGSNPGSLSMYAHVPDDLDPDAPLIVALHGCTQSAQAYHQGSGWSELADEYGFAVVYPQTSSANNANSCFNFFQPGDSSRGQGEALSIKQMTTHAQSTYDLSADETFVTGLSAGGAMTSVMLATYPDVYAGGSIVAGLPYRCADDMISAFGCMSSPPDRTPQQWGDLARAAADHSGSSPRVAVWHGSADTTVVPANARESVDQFTDLAGVSATPTGTESLPASTTRSTYGSGEVVEYSVEGMGHGTPVDPGSGQDQCGQAGAYFLDTICSARYDAAFFGLTAPVDPSDPTDPGDPSDPGDPTDPDDPAEPVCVTASNYAHTVAGRAYARYGTTYATGSDDPLGLWNVFTTTSLEETSPGHWELGC